jgi:anti-sigma-K factor RskA
MTADHDRMEDSVAAYVLGACDEEEREVVRAHLEGCASCRLLERRLSQAVGALPLTADEARPPDRLRARILAAAAAGQTRPADEPPSGRILALPRPDDRRPDRAGWPRRRFSAQWAAVAVLVAGLLVLTGWNVVLNRQLNAPPASYSMAGTGSMAGVSGTVTRQRDVALLSLTGMSQPDAGRVYEVWLIDAAGRATPGGIFTPAADGSASVGINRPLGDVRTVAVTQEDGPQGARAPTQKPELAGQLG